LLFSALAIGTAQAGEVWNQHHPRRAEVLGRVHHLNYPIHQELLEGEVFWHERQLYIGKSTM
jgi:hypothetical protein